MPVVVTLVEIRKALAAIDPIPLIEAGFAAYSRGDVVVPPVGELVFDNPPGDVHIKYGYIERDDFYVIKIASGFYDNPKLGLPSGDGLMLVFSQKTGVLEAILLDEGYLTNLRTAVAGAVVAKYLAPRQVSAVGIVGAGVQGRMQLDWLRRVRKFDEAVVWGVDEEELAAYRRDMESPGLKIRTTLRAEEVAAAANLIVTCTPATTPIIKAEWVRPGTHITAVGSDTALKQELEAAILARADRVVVDSLSQSELRGEVYKAVSAGAIGRDRLVELGRVISDEKLRRASENEITVADLTGVAVQDIQISKAVWLAIRSAL
ncbi:MAG: ornithine cyclodeaminase family protein [Acidobacteria bacterium]|nr:ornithine cyclodeaminase family protein [Acidobacteriota bacterium]MBE3124757.1 ornithine cyclodeaminase family protein [Acidobacteriota bacterium]MBE3130416.1 ornithine cyclodeaminase family protein [Acidobacteriota bacterium]